ncbi:YfhO family protein [Longitalea luteola]|uniref:YfhO family protein n=1 Tax=Longitalea luteola TaxID=2812563 RepID=UPI001A960A28|nr:YfhO family protein [Longitalea luteola]
MKKTLWQQVMPHLISVAIFLIVAMLFAKPALESDTVMKQGDIINWQGMVHQSDVYKEKHGHYPLWTPSMYAGMPAYQIATDGPWTPLVFIDALLKLGLPKPINIFFLACICFYFLCMCLRIRPWVAVIGGLAFAYSTTFPIFITAGHDTQMLSLAYAPAVLGGIILLFDGKYISGFIVTALFAALQISGGHQQVSYYMFLVIGVMVVFFLIRAFRSGKAVPQLKATGLAAVACILGILFNAIVLLTVYEYSKESKRGGQLVMPDKRNTKDVMKGDKTKGLSKDYAFQWSYGWTESLTLMFPGVMGYGQHYAERDGDQFMYPKLDENSHVATHLQEKLNLPEDQATNIAFQLSGNLYWGDQPFTAGPIYLGAIVCLLFIFSMVYLDGKHKWWILTAAILGILLALGKHFAAFNYFLFDYLPFYNKFRVPTMALEITGLVLPIGAAMGLEKLVATGHVDLKDLKLASIITGTVFLVAAGIYFSADYSNENKKRTAAISQVMSGGMTASTMAALDSINRTFPAQPDNRIYENFLFQAKADPSVARGIINALREDRQAAYGKTLVSSLIFVLIGLGILYLYAVKKINAIILLAGIGLATIIDLMIIDTKYLNSYSFGSKENYEASTFPLTAADHEILKDKDPNFRVYNTTAGDPFQGDSRTSYYHKSIGGYHPARLGIYDDLMTYQLMDGENQAVINMLNVKYRIEQNRQTNSLEAVPNPNALGNVWFVKNVQYVDGPVKEMQALNNFNPAETAIVDNSYKSMLSGAVPADSGASIKQVAFDFENIKYESNSNAPHVAVFSEIFYKEWKAYIDGKPAPIAKANYVLRALLIPAGKHNIEFKFEPTTFRTGYTLSAITGWLIALLLAAYIGWQIWLRNKKTK